MKDYMNNVKNIQDFVDQNENTKSEIQKCIKYLVRETNKQKLNYGQLRYMFRMVRERCEIDIPRESKTLYELPSNEQVIEFYSHIKIPMHRLIFETLQKTGLRVSELCNLMVSNIDFSENLIFVKEGKGQKDRVVPIGNKLKEKLSLYLENRNNKYLFESNRNTKFSTRRIEQLCRKYSSSLNNEVKITPHTFRHLYFSYLAANNVPKEQRMLLAGHSSEKTQDIYTHLTLGNFKEDIIKLMDT